MFDFYGPGATLRPCFLYDADRIPDLIDQQVDMPSSLCSFFDVPDPEHLIATFLILTSHVPHCLLEIFQCILHGLWSIFYLIGPCGQNISHLEICQHLLPAPLRFILCIDYPNLFLCRLGSLLPFLAGCPIPAIMELFYIDYVSLPEVVFFSPDHSCLSQL